MASSFRGAVIDSLKRNEKNHFGRENYDEERFGKFWEPAPPNSLKQAVKKIIRHDQRRALRSMDQMLEGRGELFEKVYTALSPVDRQLFVELIAYRVLGHRKVKLPSNNEKYWKALSDAKRLGDDAETYNPHFMHFMLKKFDLRKIGFDVKLLFSDVGIAIDFIIEQYAYSKGGEQVKVEPGDTVLDLGACWGDTALYFASKVQEQGKVYSFEFIPDNIDLFRKNVGFNPALANRVELVDHPVTDKSGDEIYFKANGPGSRIEVKPFEGQTGITTTLTIDDFVDKYGVKRVDFIKMDIEGAEQGALRGAIKTIRKHRPKLAIATYHSIADFVEIPNWILDLDLGYRIFIDHFTIHDEETVCFAKTSDR